MQTSVFFLLFMLLHFVIAAKTKDKIILLEAESFSNTGGWVVDQQSIDQIGSSYLLAHGLGRPVDDAVTTFHAPNSGNYKVWVRTRDWVAPWNAGGAPGKFQLSVNGRTLETVFGTNGAEWSWQYGGEVSCSKGANEISLHDLTGFDGRCDAIFLSTDPGFEPPQNGKALADFRDEYMESSNDIADAGEFDFVVVGGGMAGCCAAVTAARLGCKVALIQNRPVLGGNNSSEVRVGLSGLIHQEPYPVLGDLVDEIGPVGHWNLWEAQRNPDSERSKKILEEISRNPEKKEHNAGPSTNYNDDKKRQIVENEENISLFLDTHVYEVEKKKGKIVAVIAKNIRTGQKTLFRGKLFADCTGDGNLGYLAGADFRMGRESKKETGEIRAPEKADNLLMGTSVQWNSVEEDAPAAFPSCPWAVQFDESTCHYLTKGDWDWETGAYRDQINEMEMIRDHALRVVYGNWDYIKNKGNNKEKFANRRLSWVAYIGGKRETRRLLGDVILKEQDILNQTAFPDACFTTTWGIDLHYPIETGSLNIEPYRSRADIKEIEPYSVPYRTLYSRNVSNLFMAGRNISVTHVALGTVRVMRTTGMMGEVIGRAARICIKEDCSPRELYLNHLNELLKTLEKGVPSN
ncbi:FAD-dependent oxidoreductase [Maribellus sp. CM-23]|uniref:FAD-dependent oxidoreductase n=1 Tax=Maribellus sp. CM-23 TaxID=2781026 RepID=UPI001F368E5C|nr:FAD-dependent oxidoreductase [Maribellus sp. CM-23]MCE4563487.1 FAD-dependent oxidoreductase [Maribellus sp. CM-23]